MVFGFFVSIKASCIIAIHVQDKMLGCPSVEGFYFDFHFLSFWLRLTYVELAIQQAKLDFALVDHERS